MIGKVIMEDGSTYVLNDSVEWEGDEEFLVFTLNGLYGKTYVDSTQASGVGGFVAALAEVLRPMGVADVEYPDDDGPPEEGVVY